MRKSGLSEAQARFMIALADNAGMKTVYGTEARTRDILVDAGLVKMGRTYTAYLTKAGFEALGRGGEF